MKTKRRHELQSNVLAEWLGHQAEQLRPYSRVIGISLVAILVVALAASFFSRDQATRNAVSWEDYHAATFSSDPKSLHDVAIQHAGTPASFWALQREADLMLAEGIANLYVDTKTAKQQLKDAQTAYLYLIDALHGNPEIELASYFGLAQAYEVTNERDDAKKNYEKVVELNRNSAYTAEAKRRLEMLEDKELVAFLNWFSRQNKEPVLDPQFQDPPDFPDMQSTDLDDLTDLPNLSIPGASTEVEPKSEPVPGADEGEPESADSGKAATEPNRTEAEGTPETAPANAPPADKTPTGTEDAAPAPDGDDAADGPGLNPASGGQGDSAGTGGDN